MYYFTYCSEHSSLLSLCILTGGLDNCVKLWDVLTFEEMGKRIEPQER